MKRKVERYEYYCDICGGKASSWDACDNCKKIICYDCQEKHVQRYSHGIYFQGSGDGMYCNDCDRILTKKKDERIMAYKKIKELKQEQKNFYEDFNIRAHEAEENLTRINEQYKKRNDIHNTTHINGHIQS